MKQLSPCGEEFTGFSVTIGEITDPAEIARTYLDIDAIFKSNPSTYKVTESNYHDGTFKSFEVSTN